MNYELKEKINITQELLSELEMKSWQEIEYLQAQIDNLAEGPMNEALRQLFKNLLTSYYVFTGGLENLNNEKTFVKAAEFENKNYTEKELTVDMPIQTPAKANIYPVNNTAAPLHTAVTKQVEIEPFEYFVDFDDPLGEPISDEDLYGK